jgi:hypothetical protein
MHFWIFLFVMICGYGELWIGWTVFGYYECVQSSSV